MPPLPLLRLDSLNTETGCLQHLLVAECRSPAVASYSFAQIQLVARAMKFVLLNRKKLGQNYRFCSVGAASLIDFICAPVSATGCQQQQFDGFTASPGRDTAVVDPAVLTRIQQTVGIANNPAHPQQLAYHQHVSFIIQLCSPIASNSDPYAAIPAMLGGKAVYQGGYFWRSQGSGSPGGTAVEIPTPSTTQAPPGTLQGITFYTLTVAASLAEAV